jgi:hypothetical protein
MVDDEPAGRTQTLRTESAPLAVASEHEQLRTLRGCDDLALDSTVPLDPGGRARETRGRGLQQLVGRCRGLAVEPRGRIALRMSAPEHSDEGAVGDRVGVRPRHVQQDDLRVCWDKLPGRADA